MAHWLTQARDLIGVNQQTLADRAGVKRHVIQKAEQGTREMRWSEFEAVTAALTTLESEHAERLGRLLTEALRNRAGYQNSRETL
jgi:predicted transcriptional regulator